MGGLNQKLVAVQSELKAPKSQRNNFGKYNYRSCEDILEAVKPLLKQHELTILLQDDIVNIGTRYYVKATAILSDGETTITATAFAREEESKKGMDGSQVTGASSSYARKYALNGLFAIDDTKDSDTTNNETKSGEPTKKEYKCAYCGKNFKPFTSADGTTYSAGQMYHMSEKKYGKPYCTNECAKKATEGEVDFNTI
ncbi:MAG: ERF family protein [Clostridia bacterium]|nr:ERF family protein [Clostridia bacterium]